jgi:AcrR family transcriptional regulator
MPRQTFFNLPQLKRQRVIDAAVEEFAERPFRAASLDNIAAASGVSKGSLYQYFEDKAELYRWLLSEYLPERKLAAMESVVMPESMDLFAQLEASFFASLSLFVKEPRLAQLGAVFLAPVPEPELRDLHHKSGERSHAALVQMVRRAQARGEVRIDLAADSVAVLIATIMGHGLLEALARRMDTSRVDLARNTRALGRLPKAELEALVREFSGMLRRAVGRGEEP